LLLRSISSSTMGADKERESDDVYAAKVSLGPTVNALLKSVCEDLPDQLQPYLLGKLIATYPAAAKDLGPLEPEATAWKKHDVGQKTAKKVLLQYLDDIRWSPTAHVLCEQVCFKRPTNAQAFMIELLAKGDPFADIEPAADTDAAAAKMQALQRGRMQRKKAAEKKAAEKAAEEKEQAEAAARMQAARRGHAARKEVSEKKAAAELERKEQEMAATKMQALQRGKNARKASAGGAGTPAVEAGEVADQAAEVVDLPGSGVDPEMDAAAAKMQAAQRGKKAKDEYVKQRKEREEAATKMQALQRGKNARKAS